MARYRRNSAEAIERALDAYHEASAKERERLVADPNFPLASWASELEGRSLRMGAGSSAVVDNPALPLELMSSPSMIQCVGAAIALDAMFPIEKYMEKANPDLFLSLHRKSTAALMRLSGGHVNDMEAHLANGTAALWVQEEAAKRGVPASVSLTPVAIGYMGRAWSYEQLSNRVLFEAMKDYLPSYVRPLVANRRRR